MVEKCAKEPKTTFVDRRGRSSLQCTTGRVATHKTSVGKEFHHFLQQKSTTAWVMLWFVLGCNLVFGQIKQFFDLVKKFVGVAIGRGLLHLAKQVGAGCGRCRLVALEGSNFVH